MSLLSKKLRSLEGGGLMYWCQGCEETHVVYTGQGTGPRWSYNGNPNAPTFKPSVLVRGGHFAPGWSGKDCWCTVDWEKKYPGKPKPRFKCNRCHTFITDGLVQFLSDCSHQFAGQTLPLPDLPEYLQDTPEGSPNTETGGKS